MSKRNFFQKGDTIFHEGNPGDSIYIIEQGEVEISQLKNNGEKLVIGILGANDIFGEMGLIDNMPRGATATAISDCKVSVIHKVQFDKMISQNPDILAPLVTLLNQRMLETLALLKSGFKLPGKEKRKHFP